MKNRRKIMAVTIMLAFILIFFLYGKSITGYYYLPSINERIIISPPPHTENKLQPILIKDSNEIEKFVDIVKPLTNDPMGEGTIDLMAIVTTRDMYILA